MRERTAADSSATARGTGARLDAPDPPAAVAFSGDGEMAVRCRAFDWASTPLGPVAAWPVALRVAAQMVLAAGLPNVVLWGPALIQLYNDSYARLIRAKHPLALGRGNREVWPEVWHLNGPIYDRVFAGETVTVENAHYPLDRQGADGAWTREDAYLTISFSPIRDGTGAVGGVLANMLETTRDVERRGAEAERDRLATALAVERGRLAAVFQQSPSFLAVLRGPENVFEFVNDAYAQIIGRGRDVIGRPLFDALPETRGQGFDAYLGRVRATGEALVFRDLPVLLDRTPGAPREERFIDITYLPLVEPDGSHDAVIAHGTDVTEQVRARRLLEDSNRQLEAQQAELEATNQQLQDQTAELEMQAEELQATAARLEERTAEAEGVASELAESEARFRTLAQGLPVQVWTATPDGRLDYVSAQTSAYFGVPESRIIGDGWGDVVHPEDLPVAGARWRHALATGTPYEVEFRLRRADGAYRWHLGRAVPRRGPSGDVVGWLGSNTDVEAATAAALAAERFGALSAASPVGIFDADLGGNLTYANPRLQAIWGVPEAEMLGAGWATSVHPEDVEALARDWRAALVAELPFDREYRIVRPDGHQRVVHGRSAIIRRRDGRAVGTVGTIDDVTTEREAEAALRASEARLRDVFEQAPVAVAVLTGPDHVYTVVSPRYAETPGRGRPLLGRPVREAFPEVAATGLIETMDGVYVTGEPFVEAERQVFIDGPDGAREEHFYNVGYQALRDAGGRVYAIASVTYDITAQILARRDVEAARQEAERARAAAEEANQAKSLFLANMSHELRTPLNAIGGYTQLIELGVHGPVTDAQRTSLGRVHKAQARLLGLINDVLNYAKLEGGRVEYDLRSVDVRDIVADVAPLVEPQLAAKGLGLTLALPDTPCLVWADREKLGQVLVNLLSNAIKFTDARDVATGAPGRVTVAVGTRAGTGDQVFLRVADTGRGIPRDKQDAIFEPFVQVRTGYAQATEGTGLGLAISRDLARGMGGDLRVRSREGSGSTFTVALRRAGVAPVADAATGTEDA